MAVLTLKRAAGVVGLAVAVWIGSPAAHVEGEGIRWRDFSSTVLEEARRERRPAVVDFRADWCLPCIEMERTTFVEPEVQRRAEDFAMLRADVTEMSKDAERMLSDYEVLGVPTTIFFGPDGSERERIVGYIAPDDFLSVLERTDSGAGVSRLLGKE